MTLAIVQSQNFGTLSTVSSIQSNVWSPTTTGNLLVICIRNSSNVAINTISDSVNITSSWTFLSKIAALSTSLQFAYCKNITGNSNRVTVTFASSVLNPFGVMWEVTGVDPTNPFDTSASGAITVTNATGTITTTSYSTAVANEIILAMSTCNGNLPADPPPIWTWGGGISLTEDFEWPTGVANVNFNSAAHTITNSPLNGITTTAHWFSSSWTGNPTSEAAYITAFKAPPPSQAAQIQSRPAYGSGRTALFGVNS